jgi:hypothetical protein
MRVVDGDDLSYVHEIYIALLDKLQDLSNDMLSDKRFLTWSFNAVVNMMCRMAIVGGLSRQDIVDAITEVWDETVVRASDKDKIVN